MSSSQCIMEAYGVCWRGVTHASGISVIKGLCRHVYVFLLKDLFPFASLSSIKRIFGS